MTDSSNNTIFPRIYYYLTCCKTSNNIIDQSANIVIDNSTNTHVVNDNNITKNDIGEVGWENEFFKKFEWLNHDKTNVFSNINDMSDSDSSLDSENNGNRTFEQKCKMFNKACGLLEQYLKNEDPVPEKMDENATLNLYFVGLANNRILIHASFNKPREQVIEDCIKLYEYARINKPDKIIYVMNNIDFYDVNKHVKMFMQMFGIDDCRGGSYTDVILPEYLTKALLHEFEISSMDYYIKREQLLTPLKMPISNEKIKLTEPTL